MYDKDSTTFLKTLFVENCRKGGETPPFCNRSGDDTMTYKPCPRCQKLIPHGMTYCSDCKPVMEQAKQEAMKQKQHRYNQKRNKQYKSFYNSKAWKQLSRAKLASVEWKCEAHIDSECTNKPIQTAEGWELRLDWENLEAVCTHCHNLRHPEKLHKFSDPDVLDLKKISEAGAVEIL